MSLPKRWDANYFNSLTASLYPRLDQFFSVFLLIPREVYMRCTVKHKWVLVNIGESSECVGCSRARMPHLESLSHDLESIVFFLVLHYNLYILAGSAEKL